MLKSGCRGGRHQHEFAGEHAERRQTGDGDDAEGEQHRETRIGHGQASDGGDPL
jgi:hypothetical protein